MANSSLTPAAVVVVSLSLPDPLLRCCCVGCVARFAGVVRRQGRADDVAAAGARRLPRRPRRLPPRPPRRRLRRQTRPT